MSRDPWRKTVEAELNRAEEARTSGNEGQARVCARRAAGGILREYMRRKGAEPEGLSAYEVINLLREDATVPEAAREKLARLVQRVEEGGTLPEGVDLIAEARSLYQALQMED